jgi:hypothetical protein
MEETVTAAYCRACGRTGSVAAEGAGFWCAWCAAPCEVELRPLEVVTRATADRFRAGAQVVDPENAPLQPLRVTAGWTVSYNNALYEVDPTEDTIPWWWIFKSDMLTMVHEHRRRLLDLGWTPEGDVEGGAYRLRLYEGDHGGKLLRSHDGRDRAGLVREIEFVLHEVSRGAL